MTREKAKRIAKRITALAAAVAMAATFTFPAEIGDGFFDGFGNAIVASAASVNLDLANGSIVITDTGYSVGGSAETTYTGDYVITGSCGANTGITVSGTQNITLDNVTINSDGVTPFKVINGANVTVNLVGSNAFGNGWDGVHTTNIVVEDNANLTFTGSGSLSCCESCNYNKLLIGNNAYVKIYASAAVDLRASGAKIISGSGTLSVDGGTIKLRSDNYFNPGSIFENSVKVKVNSGTLEIYEKTGSNGFGSQSVTLNGGTIKCDIASAKLKLPDLIINGGALDIPGGIEAVGTAVVNTNFEIPAGSTFTVSENGVLTISEQGILTNNGTFENNGTVKNSGEIVNNTTVTGTGKIYNENGGTATGSGTYATAPVTIGTDFLITPTNSSDTLVYGTDYTYPADTGVLTIKSDKAITIANASTGSTTNRIEVEQNKNANITLAGVNIVSTSGSPFAIANDSLGNVTVTLADGTENVLESQTWDTAGLSKVSGINSGTLTINGNGKLTATGCLNHAGIGGYDTANIVIESGTIFAYGGGSGAGIGSGLRGTATNITIKGGTVTAKGGDRRLNTSTYGYINVGGSGIGGGADGNASDIFIQGGSVLAEVTNNRAKPIGKGCVYSPYASPAEIEARAITPTNGTDNVYLLEITNTDGSPITINSKAYPSNHNGEAKIYAYLPAKTSIADSLEVKVGTETTNYYYDTTKSAWLAIVDIPNEDTTVFTYTGSEQIYTIAESDYYTVTGNKQTNAGTYDVTVSLTDTANTVWSDGTTADLTYTFKINKKPATVTPPTASTAISYGKTLADTGLTAGWTWKDGSTYIPKVSETTSSAFKIVDDDDIYDYSGLSGFTYDEENNKLSYNVPITVNPATPKITVTANPSSAITGKETTVTVTAEVKNPNNDLLNDCHPAELSYKIGDGAEQAITGGTFVIPANTPNGTTFTIIARTSATANYNAGTGTSTVVVSNCTHPNKPAAWKNDATHHWHECPDCGAELGKAEHSSNAAATETSPEVCKDCEYVMNSALGHIHANHLTFVTEVPETCTTDGVKAHYECDCGKLFADDQAATEVTADDLKIAAHHSYGTEWVSDNDDDHYHVCSVCGDKTDITAHSYGNWKITVPATAEANGKKERSCTVCGYVQEGTVIYGGDDTTGDIDNATNPEDNACHADLELTDEEIISKIPLTPEELEAIENGADLEVYMVVIDYSGNVPSADKALAEAVLTGDMQIGMYIDVTLFVKVGDNDPRAVTNTNGDLKITFEMPEKLINTDENVTREYSIIRVHGSEAAVLDCEYNNATGKGSFKTDKFSSYAIAYKDIEEEEPAPEPEPEKTVYYPVITSGNVFADKSYAAAGQTVNVTAGFGYDIIVTAENGRQIAKMTEKGSFTMPASKVYVKAVQNETYALMATAWRQSYVYSYDADMNKIKVCSTKKRGVIVIDLGEEYAGRTFTIYSGRKSTKVKVTEGVLDENGKFVFEVPDGKNYTLVVED